MNDTTIIRSQWLRFESSDFAAFFQDEEHYWLCDDGLRELFDLPSNSKSIEVRLFASNQPEPGFTYQVRNPPGRIYYQEVQFCRGGKFRHIGTCTMLDEWLYEVRDEIGQSAVHVGLEYRRATY